MDLRTQFVLQQKLSFYQTPKQYHGASEKNRKSFVGKKVPQKSTFMDDIIKAKSKIPGPSNYITNPEQKVKEKRYYREKFQKGTHLPRQSYLDPILKRSKSLPSVGSYNISKNIQKSSQFAESDSNQKKTISFRPTIFDSINRDLINVSPGLYEIQKIKNRSPKYSIAPQSKKQLSLPKIPSPAEYNPVPSSYTTFEKRSMEVNDEVKNSTFGIKLKDKIKQKSPGPVYNLVTNWGKKKPFQSQFNLYKSISLGPKDRVYHSIGSAR